MFVKLLFLFAFILLACSADPLNKLEVLGLPASVSVDSPAEVSIPVPDDDSPFGSPITPVCVGTPPENWPSLCKWGYWVIPSDFAVSGSGYQIDGRLFVDGNFTLNNAASLAWKGFLTSEDSRPGGVFGGIPDPNAGKYTLSHINVTLDVELTGDILVDLTSEQMKSMFGPIDTKNPRRTWSQIIIESRAGMSTAKLVAPSTNDCRKLSMSSSVGSSPNGRQQLSAIFSINDSDCKNKRNLASIVAPAVFGGVALLLLAIVLLTRYSDSCKQIVRPYSARKVAGRIRGTTATESHIELEGDLSSDSEEQSTDSV